MITNNNCRAACCALLLAFPSAASASENLAPDRQESLQKVNLCIDLSKSLVPPGGSLVYSHPYLEQDEDKTLVTIYVKWRNASPVEAGPEKPAEQLFVSPETPYYCIWNGEELLMHGDLKSLEETVQAGSMT
ncbi:hypothetical protein [Skermanella pratensis]|uniref:hypothetical protein n=1 Tax=Skermanella pratensis TaxID=2233999 RepID=UPI0013011F1E|nr:hypothetical protein [Skermanella pratensis]